MTKFIATIVMNLVTPKAAPKSFIKTNNRTAPRFACKYKVWLKDLAKDEHSRLFIRGNSGKEKILKCTDSVVSYSVCFSKLLCLSEPKVASLLRNLSFSINYRFVMSYGTGTGANGKEQYYGKLLW